MNTVRVMLVDDHEILREGLKSLLELDGTVQVVATESTARAALRKLELLQVDVMLVDVTLPEEDGIWLTREVRQLYPQVPVLMLTMHAEDPIVTGALDAGAAGYLTKSATRNELMQALLAVHSGASYIQPEIAGLVLRTLRSRNHVPEQVGEALSKREREILQLAAMGKRNQDIAAQLHLSVSTVKTHLRGLYRKLDVTDRTQAVLTAIQRRIIDEPRLGPTS